MRLMEVRDSPKTTQLINEKTDIELGSIALHREDPWNNIMSLSPLVEAVP